MLCALGVEIVSAISGHLCADRVPAEEAEPEETVSNAELAEIAESFWSLVNKSPGLGAPGVEIVSAASYFIGEKSTGAMNVLSTVTLPRSGVLGNATHSGSSRNLAQEASACFRPSCARM